MAPRTPTHPAADDLRAFALGRLTGPAAGQVGDHLAGCPDCRRHVDQAKAAAPSLAGVTAGVMGAAPPVEPADLQLPSELANHPDYEFLRELGRGGMGVVYLARSRLMDRLEVLKVLGRGLLDKPEAVERFRREIVAAGKLRHPNIVTAFSVARAGDLLMLAMEYVEGLDLARYVAEFQTRKGKLPPVAHACHFARQAALGLQHAHEQGMVHRDVKPHNLMLTPKGQVKILDFGLARLREQPGQFLTANNAVMGTPAFMAPEQALDARTADTRADLYSLGGTLFYLLTGRPPFLAETAMQLVLAHLETPPPAVGEFRPDVPGGLAAVVARLLAKKPEDRYQTPAEVAAALAPFARGRAPVAAPAAPPAPRASVRPAAPAGVATTWADTPEDGGSLTGFVPARRRSRRVGWVVGAVALLALLAAGGVAVWIGAGAGQAPPDTAGAVAPSAGPASPQPRPVSRRAFVTGGGHWRVSGAELVQGETDAAVTSLSFGDPAWTDYDLSFDVRITRRHPVEWTIGVNASVRKSDMANFATLSLNPGRPRSAGARTAGIDRTVERTARGPDVGDGAWHPVVIRARGPRVTFTLGGEELFGLAADQHPAGAVALATREVAARFRNLRVTDPHGAPLWEGWPDLPAEREPCPDPSVKPVAIWRIVQQDPGPLTFIHELYSNGRVDSPFSTYTWSRTGNSLVLHKPDPKAPGGAWVNTCQIAPDGRTLTGETNNGVEIRGERLDPVGLP